MPLGVRSGLPMSAEGTVALTAADQCKGAAVADSAATLRAFASGQLAANGGEQDSAHMLALLVLDAAGNALCRKVTLTVVNAVEQQFVAEDVGVASQRTVLRACPGQGARRGSLPSARN